MEELFKLLEENTDSTYGSFYLYYNDHHSMYVNRENNGCKYEEKFFEHYCSGCLDEEDYREEVEDIKEHVKYFDRVYKLVWYKDTPIGSYTLYGSDLEIIKEQVKEILER